MQSHGSRHVRPPVSRRISSILNATLIALSGALLAAPAAAGQDEDDVVAETPAPMRAAVANWQAALDSDDADRVSRAYAVDGWFKAPCEPFKVGRSAIAGGWADILLHSPANLDLQPRSFEVSRGRDVAIERGRAQFLLNIGGLPYGTNVDYLRIWRRSGGDWLIEADLYTPGAPCEAE